MTRKLATENNLTTWSVRCLYTVLSSASAELDDSNMNIQTPLNRCKLLNEDTLITVALQSSGVPPTPTDHKLMELWWQ